MNDLMNQVGTPRPRASEMARPPTKVLAMPVAIAVATLRIENTLKVSEKAATETIANADALAKRNNATA
ncbi:MAG: hypothetical protein ACK55I_28020 [bacterium]